MEKELASCKVLSWSDMFFFMKHTSTVRKGVRLLFLVKNKTKIYQSHGTQIFIYSHFQKDYWSYFVLKFKSALQKNLFFWFFYHSFS